MNIGNCDFANTGEIFEIAEGEHLECPKCHKTMVTEVKGAPWKLIGIIAGVVAVIAAIGAGVYFLLGGSSKPEKIILDQKELVLEVGQTALLTATVEPKDAKATFVWSTKSKDIKVNSGGEVTALKPTSKPASVVVKVEENPDIRAICKVTVKGADTEVLIQSISFGEQSISLNEGDKKQVSLNIQPERNDESVSITSSDESVATVSSDGTVTAKKAGTAQIAAKTSKSGLTAVVEVKVTKKETPGGGGTGGGTTTGTLRLSYGTYTGQIKNGYPNGQGRLVYSKSRQINRNDSKGRTAQPGESVQGTFVNGFITVGKHYDASGNLIGSLNIGSVDGQYEQK